MTDTGSGAAETRALDIPDFHYVYPEDAHADLATLFDAMRAVQMLASEPTGVTARGLEADEFAALMHVFTEYGYGIQRRARSSMPGRALAQGEDA